MFNLTIAPWATTFTAVTLWAAAFTAVTFRTTTFTAIAAWAVTFITFTIIQFHIYEYIYIFFYGLKVNDRLNLDLQNHLNQ